ncbi:MAG: hypothetical protein ACOYBP_00720 [Microbacteriaceae bacterium]
MNETQIDAHPAETARNDHWDESLAGRLAGALGEWLWLHIAAHEPIEVQIADAGRDWLRGQRRIGSSVVIPLAQIRACTLGPASDSVSKVDPVAPSFRSMLGELSRRRTEIDLWVCGGARRECRIHHVGSDYVQLDGERVELVAIAAIELVEFTFS